ncbi:hypothetical protein MTO96_011135 [Rhipicephalus appendiculatus]
MVLVEELLERFRRLTLGALVGTASLVEGCSFAGSVASAAFHNFRAAVVAMGFGASGSTHTPLGWSTAWPLGSRSLVGRASAICRQQQPGASLARYLADRGRRPPFCSPWRRRSGSGRHVRPSIPMSSQCSSVLPAPGDGLWWNSGESPG